MGRNGDRHTSSTSPWRGNRGKLSWAPTVRTEAQVLSFASGFDPA